jgi:septal ring factor EnvC (AmiA/AmiB activator)
MWRSATLALALLAASAQAQEAPRDKLNATASALQASKENAEALKAKLESSQHDVASLRESATELAADVQDAERRVSQEEGRFRSVSIKLAVRQKDFDARKDEYAQTLASMMRMQKMPATAMVVNPDNARELLQTAHVMQQVNGALAARAAQLRSELDALEKLRNEARTSKDKLAKESGVLTAKQKQLNSDLAKRQEIQRRLSKDLSATQERVADLSRQSASLQELIGKLEADRMNVAPRGSKPKPPAATPSRGHWKIPLAGRVVHRFGER